MNLSLSNTFNVSVCSGLLHLLLGFKTYQLSISISPPVIHPPLSSLLLLQSFRQWDTLLYQFLFSSLWKAKFAFWLYEVSTYQSNQVFPWLFLISYLDFQEKTWDHWLPHFSWLLDYHTLPVCLWLILLWFFT